MGVIFVEKILALLMIIIFSISTMVTTVMADEKVKLIINGTEVDFSDDQEPVIQNGRTFVPFRTAFEKIGAEVKWHDDIRLCKAEYGGISVGIAIGDTKVSLSDGSEIESDVPAQIINGRTMVPLRILSESIGAEVNWDKTTRTITVNTLNKIYSINKYEASIDGSDGYACIYSTIYYPKFFIDKDYVPSLNTQLENSAKKAADSFVDSYLKDALEIYNNPPTHLYEVPYSLYGNCEVEITDKNIAIIKTEYFETKYSEDLNIYTDTIKINLENGEVVE